MSELVDALMASCTARAGAVQTLENITLSTALALLEEAAALAEFLAEQIPALHKEWEKQRDALRRTREL